MKRSVFFVSDRTGITAEALGHSLLTQFEDVEFEQVALPFIDTVDKAREAVARINRAAAEDGQRPLLFSTLLNDEIREIFQNSEGLLLDFFDAFVNPLEDELGMASSHAVGRSHGIRTYSTYKERIDAVNFALNNDDGMRTSNYGHAEIILVGVSRSGKTPTCLYLALRYGILAANYPLTEEDLESGRLPRVLGTHRERLFGLTIDPERLHHLRRERRPEGRYATLTQCRHEVGAVEAMFRREGIPYVDTSTTSVEEIATLIVHRAGLERPPLR